MVFYITQHFNVRLTINVLFPHSEIKRASNAGSADGSKNPTPESPGTPTHASGSLSLSDGRDFFDDEIADQPALLFRSKYQVTVNWHLIID